MSSGFPDDADGPEPYPGHVPSGFKTGPFRVNVNFVSHGEMLGRRTYLLRVFALKTRLILLLLSSS